MTVLDFYKNRLKGRGFNEKQIKELTCHKDLPWLQFAEDYHKEQLHKREIGVSDLNSQVFIVIRNDLVEIEKGSELVLLSIGSNDRHEFMDKSSDIVWLDADCIKRKKQ